jgi:hypothetical protein
MRADKISRDWKVHAAFFRALENFARFFPRLGNAGRRRVGDSADITATWAGRVSARGGHVCPGGDLNEESRNGNFLFLLSSFKKLAGFSRPWNNAKAHRKTEGAEAWRLPLRLRLCVEVFRFRRHRKNDAATSTRELELPPTKQPRLRHAFAASRNLPQPGCQAVLHYSNTPALRKAVVPDAARPLAQTHPPFLAQYQTLEKPRRFFPSLGLSARHIFQCLE